MTKLLTIGFPYSADRFGGSNASSLVLAQALREAGHRAHILTHGGNGRIVEEALALSLPVTRLPALSVVPGYARPERFRLGQVMAFRACRAAIRELSLDIVHTNDATMLRTWAVPSLASSVPLVAHWRSNFRESWSVTAAFRVAAAVIAVSRYSFAKLPPAVQAKTIVEYNSLNLSVSEAQKDMARADVRAHFGLPPDAVLVGVFGNHFVRKRTHVLADIIAAISRTADGRPVYGLACGGRAEPYDTQLYEKIERFALQHRLLRPGFLRPVEKWMCACDVVLAPAIDEPLGRSVLEAQALNVPVIVSTDGGHIELIRHGDNGLLLDPFDIDGWIAATERVLNDSALAAALARSGRASVARLTPDQHASRVAAVYQRLVGRSRQAA
jgi:glycosyltransferase involved in cell wall biosynthesis